MEVKFIDKMGSDLSVVNAARVSFAKTSEWESVPEEGIVGGYLFDQDKKLIYYLAKHNHWSPFGHASMQFHIKAPVFVARQLVKHQVGLVWNEVSRRYVDYEVEFHMPDRWRARAENKKQGSGDEEININTRRALVDDYEQACKTVKWTYEELLRKGVAPEQARMVLPQSMMTEWHWSGTLMAFARVCNLRCKSDTQLETRMIADQIDAIGEKMFPYSWAALTK